jgi:hypothetical protein
MIKGRKYKYKKKDSLKSIKNEIIITETDRIVYAYKQDSRRKMIEITTVAYTSLIKNEWITIVYYDNDKSHSVKLHVHITDSFYDRNDAPTSQNVRQKGTVRRLHTWAVEDLKNNWNIYKDKFLKRSKLRNE